MKTYAVVPVKHLTVSKSRLSSVLTRENRKLLTLTMLEDVLMAIKASTIKDAVVVGSDSCVCKIAVDSGFFYIKEEVRGLNPAITSSINWCIKKGAESVLVLPADIPLLSSADINRMVEMAENMESLVVLSPSEDGGTNALYLKPPNLIPVSFGIGSFKRHFTLGRSREARVKLYYSPSVAFDIDCQEDLQRLFATLSSTLSAQLVVKVLKRN